VIFISDIIKLDYNKALM